MIPTREGALWTVDAEGRTWRAMCFLKEGRTLHRLPDETTAERAGALVGRFHLAMEDFSMSTFLYVQASTTPQNTFRSSTGPWRQNTGHRLHRQVAHFA